MTGDSPLTPCQNAQGPGRWDPTVASSIRGSSYWSFVESPPLCPVMMWLRCFGTWAFGDVAGEFELAASLAARYESGLPHGR